MIRAFNNFPFFSLKSREMGICFQDSDYAGQVDPVCPMDYLLEDLPPTYNKYLLLALNYESG
jgi:hypothetical protein